MHPVHARRARVAAVALAAAVVSPATAAGVAAAPVATAAAPAVAPAVAAASPGEELRAASWWQKAMGVDEIHRTATGKGITVAVLDTPFNADVPELGDNFSAMSTCRGVAAQSSTSDAAHGTTMAALVGGSGKGSVGGQGVLGLAPDAKVVGIAVTKPVGTEGVYCADKDNVSRAIDAAIAAGAKIISMSTTSGSTADNAAYARAQKAGVIIVAATDDHRRTIGFPASRNGVLAVNAVNTKAQLDETAAPSQFDGDIAVAAPGVHVNWVAPTKDGEWRSNGWSSGSSPAAAIVSGGLAAVWSHFPDASANQIIQLMTHTTGVKVAKGQDGKTGFFTAFRRSGKDLPDEYTGTGFGYGVFDPADMLKGDPSQYPDENPFLGTNPGLKPTYEQVTGHAPADASPSADPSATASSASPSATASSPDAQAAAPASSSTSSGTPAWVWVAVALVVVAALAGGGVVLGRRGRGAQDGTNQDGKGDGHGQGR